MGVGACVFEYFVRKPLRVGVDQGKGNKIKVIKIMMEKSDIKIGDR